MAEASTLYNVKPVYLSDLKFTDTTLKIRSSHDLAPIHFIPENLSGKDKMSLVKKFNKKVKVTPPQISQYSTRPTLSDMEISLIVSSFNSIPASTIAHTLNIHEDRVITIYNQYKHEPLRQLPLIAIYDTSRDITEDNERAIYKAGDLNHIDDPLTNKELLRPSLSDESIDINLLTSYITSRYQAGDTHKQYGALAGHIYSPTNIEELHTSLYGRAWSDDFGSVFKKSILNNHVVVGVSMPYYHSYFIKKTDRYDNTIYLKHPSYFMRYNLSQHTYLAKTYLDMYNKVNLELLEDSTFTETHAVNLNILFNTDPNKIPILFNDSKHDVLSIGAKTLSNYINKEINHKVIYTTDLSLLANYKPSSTFYLPYNIVRPPIFLKAVGSPLQDKNKKLRYRFPPNTYERFIPKAPRGKASSLTPYPAVVCKKCNTYLSIHTVKTCECKAISINAQLVSSRTPKVHSCGTIKNISVNITKLPPQLKDKLKAFTNKDVIKSKNKYMYGQNKKLFYMSKYRPASYYSYTSAIKYQHEFNSYVKYHVEVYQDSTSPHGFTYHTYNYSSKLQQQQPSTLGIFNVTPNILPLYTSFSFPVPTTLKEPHIV